MTHPQSSEAPEAVAYPFEVGSHKLIYAFSRPDAPKLQGMLKVGDASIPANDSGVYSQDELRGAAQKRIHEYTGTAQVDTELEHTEIALRLDSSGALVGFRDYDVHRVILNSGYDRYTDPNPKLNGREWFENIEAEDVAAAVEAVKEDRDFISTVSSSSKIKLYPHQQAAVDQTLSLFQDGSIEDPKRMLWNAKMRFGKTLAAYSFVKEAEDVKRVLVVTHRPDVNSSWFEDYQKFGLSSEGWRYGSKQNGNSFDDLVELDSFGIVSPKSEGLIWFASMQDLRLSGLGEDELKKNQALFAMDWDLIITDEAHEGTLTDLAGGVYDRLKTRYSLDLSGTPYNLIEAGDWNFGSAHRYRYDDVYSWSYVDEQKAKRNWTEEHSFDEPNPYEVFPEVEFRTYDVSAVLDDLEPGVFPTLGLNELFRVDPSTGRFAEERSVLAMLNKLRGDGAYNSIRPESFPFHDSFGWMFRHTLWCLPSVQAVAAMEELLSRSSSGFAGWNVVNATGLGNKEADGTRALSRVRKAVAGTAPSITLSYRMLTTGISVPEWTAVFMMSTTSNAMGYMQTAFRATTPWVLPNGSRKTKAYIFDFSAERCLNAIVEASKSSSRQKISKDPLEQDELDRKAVGEFIEYASVLSMRGAHFVAPDSDEIIARINEAYLNEVVERGFDSPKLFSATELSNYDIRLKEVLDKLRDIQGGLIPKSAKITLSELSEEDRQRLKDRVKEIEASQAEDLSKEGSTELKDTKKVLSDDEQNTRSNRKNAITILTGIACRLPMLVLAADTDEITPQDFNTLIDEESWREFMPPNLIRIKPEGVAPLEDRSEEALGEEGGVIYWDDIARFFDPAIFGGACERVRLMAKIADAKESLERAFRMASMFSLFKNPDKETVLTPWRVVNLQYGSTVGGLVTVDLAKSTAKDVYSYVQKLDTGELSSLPAAEALRLIDDGSHRASAVWVDPGKLSPVLQDELAAALEASESKEETLGAALSADPAVVASSGATTDSGAEIAAPGHSRTALELWGREKLSVYDINSKTALYPLFAALSRFYIERLKAEGRPLPRHGDVYEPSGLSLGFEREIWRETIDQSIFLNTRVDYSRSIAQRVLMGFDRSQKVNATSIDVLELKASLEWWNAGGDVEPPKKGTRKPSYMPDWWHEVEDIYGTLGAVLRLASPSFLRYHSSTGVRARLVDRGYNQQSFQKLLETILPSKGQGEEPSMGKKDAERSADRLQAVRELLDIVGQSEELPRFNLTAGNPPYQIETARTQGQEQPTVTNVFQDFQLTAIALSRITSMIYPGGRWLQLSGKGMKPFGSFMMASRHLVSVDVFPNGDGVAEGRKLFPSARIPDGLSIVLYDSEYDNQDVVLLDGTGTPTVLPGDIMPQIPSGLSEEFRLSQQTIGSRQSKPLSDRGFAQKLYSIESDFVERNPTKAFSCKQHVQAPSGMVDPVRVFTNNVAGKGGSPEWYWIERSEIKTNAHLIDKYQVTVSSAAPNSQIFTLVPAGSAHGRSRLSLASFDTEEEADNFLKYISTPFIRACFQFSNNGGLTNLARFVPDLESYRSESPLFADGPSVEDLDIALRHYFSNYSIANSERVL